MIRDKEIPENYTNLLAEIKQHIAKAQVKMLVAANQQMLWLYWSIGNKILDEQQKQGWGAKVIDRISNDISREFPKLKGFSPRNILYMKQFAEIYTPSVINLFTDIWTNYRDNPQQLVVKLLNIDNELNAISKTSFTKLQVANNKSFIISQQVVAKLPKTKRKSVAISQEPPAKLQIADNELDIISQQDVAKLDETQFSQLPIAKLSWSHHLVLINKTNDYKRKFWYMLNSIEYGISRNILSMQIESQLFERQIINKKISNFKNTLPPPHSDFANYLMKDPYIFDLAQAKDKADERSIEQQLATNITKFLLELGQGFAFVGRQVRLDIGDSDYFIDLLFYHLKLRSYVVIELKARAFEPGDTGQLNFYINVVNAKMKTEQDNKTIGLLLCKGKNEVLAEYCLSGINQPIGIADYQLSKIVPDELKSELPDIEELESELMKEID